MFVGVIYNPLEIYWRLAAENGHEHMLEWLHLNAATINSVDDANSKAVVYAPCCGLQ